MLRIAHLVNPVVVGDRGDLHLAQPITFESMRRAADRAQRSRNVEVAFQAAAYAEDRRPIHGFSLTRDLTLSVLDFGSFTPQRKLPLLGELMERLATTDADVLVYSNVDIALMPSFYIAVVDEFAAGRDALSVLRRTVRATLEEAQDLDWLESQPGESHPGHDCFIFRRGLLDKVDFGALCIGFPPVGWVMVGVLSSLAECFVCIDDRKLTFHVNDDRPWRDARFGAYFDHNRREGLRVLDSLERRVQLSSAAQALRGAIAEERYLKGWPPLVLANTEID